jgi:hypothetical protein
MVDSRKEQKKILWNGFECDFVIAKKTMYLQRKKFIEKKD